MENNLENKARFFVSYYGTETLSVFNSISTINYNSLDATAVKVGHLELKPLSSITDEDKKFLTDIMQNTQAFDEDYGSLYSADYIRSKGYALPFMGVEVEILIEYGWVKLKETK
jgi:hypothetical protein